MTATSRLAELAGRLATFGPLDQAVERMVARAGADLMGCVLGAQLRGAAPPVAAALAASSGPAPVYGAGACLAAPMAALANGAAAHALEFDDWEAPGNTHPSAVLFPAIWALAAETPLSGAKAAEAYAAGFEAIARLGEAVNYAHYNKGWHSTATLGVFGAAAAAGLALRLSTGEMANALSLALSQASGYLQQSGASGKALQAGFAARDGLIAARLAAAGMTGDARVLDGDRGFIALTGQLDLDRLDAAIARANGGALAEWGLAQKPYPCCGYAHRLIDCARALHPRIIGAEIAAIHAELPDFHYAILAHDRPSGRVEAMFSAPYLVATALARGAVGLDDIDAAGAPPADIAALMTKVEMAPTPPRRPELNLDPEQPDKIRVTLRSGAVVEETVAHPLGAPERPMSEGDLCAKFRGLVGPAPGWDEILRWTRAPDLFEALRPCEDALRM